MSKILNKSVWAVAAIAFLLLAASAYALLPTHNCTNCHNLHGSAGAPLVPLKDSLNLEVLCLGCHLTAIGATDPVQPHRTDSGYPEYYITCNDCHGIHDNMPNWRSTDIATHEAGDDAEGRNGDLRFDGWPVGVNAKMIGREDPDGETEFAIIITKEADLDKDGVPDRGAAVTQTCDDTVLNDCYVTRKRHVIFENSDPDTSSEVIHGFADPDLDGEAPGVGNSVTDFGDPDGARYDSPCRICHTQVSRNQGYGDGGQAHNNQTTCTRCHTHAGCFDRSGSCTQWTFPNRDLQMNAVTPAPSTVSLGATVTITANVTNLGTANESTYVKYYSDIDGYLGQSILTDLIPNTPTDFSLDWITTTAGTHTVRAQVQPVLLESNVANNELVSATLVSVTAGTTHDVAVTAVTAPPTVDIGATASVSVDIENQGGFTETFNVTLSSDLNGTTQTLSSGTLGAGVSTTLVFSWDSTGATVDATYTLTATADTVTGETDTADNVASTTLQVVAVVTHDVAVDSVTAPATVDRGTAPTVSVQVTNNGGATETFDVSLSSNLDGTIQTLSSGALAASASTILNFTWSTDAGTSLGTHTLTAVAATVPGETLTADNTASTTSEIVSGSVTHDVAVTSVSAPATASRPNNGSLGVAVSVSVENQGTVEETFNVTLDSDQAGSGDLPLILPVTLGPGASTVLDFTWTIAKSTTTKATHTLTATADTVSGEIDTADNTSSTTIDIK